MKLWQLREIIDEKESIFLYDGRPVKGVYEYENEWLKKAYLDSDMNENLLTKYDDCPVYGIWGSAKGLCIAINAVKEVTATFTTEIDGNGFSKEEVYNLFDYDDEDDLSFKIDEDFQEWLEELRNDLESYAEKEVEGL